MRALPYPSDRLARPYKADLRSGVSAGDRSLGARDDSSSPRQVSWLTDRRSPVPSQDKVSQWRTSGSLPAHSGATAPVSHRLPSSPPGGSRQGKPRVVADASAIMVVSQLGCKCPPSRWARHSFQLVSDAVPGRSRQLRRILSGNSQASLANWMDGITDESRARRRRRAEHH